MANIEEYNHAMEVSNSYREKGQYAKTNFWRGYADVFVNKKSKEPKSNKSYWSGVRAGLQHKHDIEISNHSINPDVQKHREAMATIALNQAIQKVKEEEFDRGLTASKGGYHQIGKGYDEVLKENRKCAKCGHKLKDHYGVGGNCMMQDCSGFSER